MGRWRFLIGPHTGSCFFLKVQIVTLNTTSPPLLGTAFEDFPLMSLLIGSHRWCQCLLCVYSAPAWEISHQATTWTRAWWVDCVVAQPGPHLRLICLAVENNDDVICNLAPCVKYGEGIWLSSRNSFPKPFHCNYLTPSLQNSLLGFLKFWYRCTNSMLAFPLGAQNRLQFSPTLHVAARWQITYVKWLMAAMLYGGL